MGQLAHHAQNHFPVRWSQPRKLLRDNCRLVRAPIACVEQERIDATAQYFAQFVQPCDGWQHSASLNAGNRLVAHVESFRELFLGQSL